MTVDQAWGFVCPFDADFCVVASAVDTALIVDDHKKDSALNDSFHLIKEIDLLAVDPSFVPVVVVFESVLAFLKQDNSGDNAFENEQDESPLALSLADGMKRGKQMRAGDGTD